MGLSLLLRARSISGRASSRTSLLCSLVRSPPCVVLGDGTRARRRARVRQAVRPEGSAAVPGPPSVSDPMTLAPIPDGKAGHRRLSTRNVQSQGHRYESRILDRADDGPVPFETRPPPGSISIAGAGWVFGSGDDRLSRRGHYHGPGGLNGRVRDGNGWGPASIVAGIRPGGGQAPSAAVGPGVGHAGASQSEAWRGGSSERRGPARVGGRLGDRFRDHHRSGPPGVGRGRIGVVKPLGC